MKPFIVLLVSAFCFCQCLHAQDSSTKKHFTYHCTINPNAIRQIGYLTDIADSAVYLSATPAAFGYRFTTLNQQKINYKGIEVLKLKRKGAVGRGCLYGALIGLAAGAIFGAIIYKEPDPNDWSLIFSPTLAESILGGAILGGGLGTGVGAIIAASGNKKYMINGDWKNLEELKASLENK